MKKLTVYKRTILKKTGFRKYPFKSVDQIVICHDGKEIKNYHFEDVDNPRLKVKFSKVLDTRRTSELKSFINSLGRSESDKWLKSQLNAL